jgi:hypothetical protein
VVAVGTPVNIINQPIKVGWSGGHLYIESHPNLDGEETGYQQRLDIALNLIERARNYQPVAINGAALKTALEVNNGLPTVIDGNDFTPPGSENFDQNQTPIEPEGAVPRSAIEEELRREESEEREFKNSPVPRY